MPTASRSSNRFRSSIVACALMRAAFALMRTRIAANFPHATLVVDREVFMIKLRNICVALLAVPLLAVAATDPTLLRLVMPDAKVVAGLQVTQTKSSAFGQFILSRMQVEDPQFQKFITKTGFDPRRDVTEIVMASNWEQATPQSRWLVAARGVFNIPMITSAAIANGGASTDFQGLSILTYAPTDQQQAALNGIAFLDQSTAIMGDIASVKSAIQRQRAKTPLPAKLLGKIQAL